MAAAESTSASCSARLLLRPVTIRARCPKPATAGARSRSFPDPKTIRVAVENSNSIGWEKVIEFHAGARFSHHGCDGITPGLVMLGFLMLGRRIRSSIG